MYGKNGNMGQAGSRTKGDRAMGDNLYPELKASRQTSPNKPTPSFPHKHHTTAVSREEELITSHVKDHVHSSSKAAPLNMNTATCSSQRESCQTISADTVRLHPNLQWPTSNVKLTDTRGVSNDITNTNAASRNH